MGDIRVVMDPEQRQKYIDMLLGLDGMSHIKEDENAAYCTVSLTSTPDDLKPHIQRRQSILMDDVLARVGIKAYDPGSAPFSPDKDLKTQPNTIYTIDSGKLLGARYFTGHNILPSDGKSIEAEKAKVFNRMSVILMDKSIRVSRMQPHRTIYLQYTDFEGQADDIRDVFKMLMDYNPGMGFNGNLPVLLGFEKAGTKIVDLEEEVYKEFPHLQYRFDGNVPILKLRAENPELFYEYRNK